MFIFCNFYEAYDFYLNYKLFLSVSVIQSSPIQGTASSYNYWKYSYQSTLIAFHQVAMNFNLKKNLYAVLDKRSTLFLKSTLSFLKEMMPSWSLLIALLFLQISAKSHISS